MQKIKQYTVLNYQWAMEDGQQWNLELVLRTPGKLSEMPKIDYQLVGIFSGFLSKSGEKSESNIPLKIGPSFNCAEAIRTAIEQVHEIMRGTKTYKESVSRNVYTNEWFAFVHKTVLPYDPMAEYGPGDAITNKEPDDVLH